MLLNIALPTKVSPHIFLLLAGPLVNFEMKYTKIYQNKDQKMFRNLTKLIMENIHSHLFSKFHTQTRTSPPFNNIDYREKKKIGLALK